MFVEGIQRLKANLVGIRQDVQHAVEEAMRQTLEEVHREVVDNTPEDTGAAKASIHMTQNTYPDAVVGEVLSTRDSLDSDREEFYLPYLEYGNDDSEGAHMFREGLKDARKELRDNLAISLRKSTGRRRA